MIIKSFPQVLLIFEMFNFPNPKSSSEMKRPQKQQCSPILPIVHISPLISLVFTASPRPRRSPRRAPPLPGGCAPAAAAVPPGPARSPRRPGSGTCCGRRPRGREGGGRVLRAPLRPPPARRAPGLRPAAPLPPPHAGSAPDPLREAGGGGGGGSPGEVPLRSQLRGGGRRKAISIWIP